MYLNSCIIASITSGQGLTLTWDVFKYNNFSSIYYIYPRLTLTWDVFK